MDTNTENSKDDIFYDSPMSHFSHSSITSFLLIFNFTNRKYNGLSKKTHEPMMKMSFLFQF